MVFYATKDTRSRLRLVDISSPSFDALAEAVDPVKVHARFHVRRPDGLLVSGVDAFAAIWEALALWPLAQACARHPILRLPLDMGYNVFALLRPLIRRGDCSGSCTV